MKYNFEKKDILISTPHTLLLLIAPQGGELKFLYYGNKLSVADARTISKVEEGKLSAYPVFSLDGEPRENAGWVIGTALCYDSVVLI